MLGLNLFLVRNRSERDTFKANQQCIRLRYHSLSVNQIIPHPLLITVLTVNKNGIYCPQADLYIDPWKRVDTALITHAHADHSRWGMKRYVAHKDSVPVMKLRLGGTIKVRGVEFGESFSINGVKISFHPAGHIVGSAQIRLEYRGEIWVVSGDYKLEDDGLSPAFESVKCHSFITESTFGLPIYQWQPQEEIFAQINQWWRENAAEGKVSMLAGYSLGKAQRILQGLDQSIGTVFTHGAVENTNKVLRDHGIPLAPTTHANTIKDPKGRRKEIATSLVIAPPGAIGTSWSRRFEPYSTAVASGWMNTRAGRKRREADRGFVLSDHADWNGLNEAVKATGAEKIFVTHGSTEIYTKYLCEQGYDARILKTQFEGELNELGESSQDQKPVTENS